MISPEEAILEIGRQYPQLIDELVEDEGLTYMQMACFRRYLQDCIERGDTQELKRGYETLRRLWLEGDSEVQNMIGVSVLEHLNFEDGKRNRRWALDCLPALLKVQWVSLTSG